MKGIKILAVFFALGAVVAAGIVVYNTLTEAPNTSLPAGTLKANVVTPAVPLSQMQLPGARPRAFEPLGPASAFALNAREGEVTVRETNCSLLPRELARQAVLIAVRESLRLPTRDCTLREGSTGPILKDGAPPSDAKAVEISTTAVNGKTIRVTVSRTGKNGSVEKLIEAEVPLPGDNKSISDYATVSRSFEALSRGEFVAALKKAGYSAPPGPQTNPVDMRDIEGIEKCLGSLSLVSQFSAVRQAHAAIRTSGESPRVLGDLVRGYANLGQLTQFLWNASYKDFIARSLLYADRMVAADPRSADALRQRAYARALAGLHSMALADLDEADRLDRGAGAPEWAPLIRSYCRYDTAALSDAIVKKPAEAPLAAYLNFLTVEHCQSESAMMGFGKVAMELNPTCLRVVDAMCERAGVSAGHIVTQAGPLFLAKSLATELPPIPGLPQAVREALPGNVQNWREPRTAAAVALALVQAGETDTAEPSWTVLGRMVQEAQFVQVWRRTVFLGRKLAVDPSEFIQASQPLIADHPYAGLIDFYGARNDPGIADRLKGLEVIDVERKEYPLTQVVVQLDPSGQEWSPSVRFGATWIRLHADSLAAEIETALRGPVASNVGYEDPLVMAKQADVVSPFMPAALAARITNVWDNVATRADQIEKDFGGHPDIGAALARQYKKLGRTDDMIRVLRRYLKVAPDYWASGMLADAYLARGDEKAWLETLKQSLQQEDFALNHAQVNERIARHFMAARRYDLAEPYATASAESGADWAMRVGAECLQGLGKWSEAEELTHDSALRYGQPENWYMWCLETGHGHLDEASRLMQQYTAGVSRSADPKAISIKVYYLLGQGNTDEAIPLERKVAEESGNSWDAMQVALWCAAKKDEKGCDDMLDLVAGHGPRHPMSGDFRPGLAQLAALFQECRAAGPTATLDLSKVDERINTANTPEWPSMLYFTAKFLEIRGLEPAARRYYIRCIATNEGGQSNRMLAAMELRKRSIDPMGVRYARPTTAPATP